MNSQVQQFLIMQQMLRDQAAERQRQQALLDQRALPSQQLAQTVGSAIDFAAGCLWMAFLVPLGWVLPFFVFQDATPVWLAFIGAGLGFFVSLFFCGAITRRHPSSPVR